MKANHISRLEERIAELEEENIELRERIDFLEGVPTIRDGMHGESIISNLINGRLTAWTAPHDVFTVKGVKIEVKFSRLGTPNLRHAGSKRWSWAHPLGTKGTKDFHRLILIGVADPRYRAYYLDETSPYVIFDLPRRVAELINQKDQMIQITTNPNRKGGETKKLLFDDCQVTVEDIQRRYGVKVSRTVLSRRKRQQR